jgi:hypothetical protein
MKFVTKKEFEDAIATLTLAVNNGQVEYGHYDNKEEMSVLTFTNIYNNTVPAEHASFVSPFVAAQKQLIQCRNALSERKELANKNAKDLEELETKERQLARLVPTLKE